MEIEYQLSKNDYLRFYKLSLKDSFYRQLGRFVLFTVALLVILNAFKFVWLWFLCSLIIAPFVVLVIYYFIPLFLFSGQLNKWDVSNPSAFKRQCLILKDDGFHVKSSDLANTLKWEGMKCAYSNAEFVYIFFHDKKFMAIPRRAFQPESEATNFHGIIVQKINSLRPDWMIRSSGKIDKPNYWLGLLCLIPVVGGIAGLIFAADGISKYKDKWYTIMGLGGIVFTLSIAYVSFCYWGLDKAYRKGFTANAQMQLNTLLKDVEFYKIKHGIYPDSLEQVGKDDPMGWNFDPLQSEGNKNGTKFNYQKVGDHYYLFSSGIDGIPNTKDDLYPQVASSDSLRFGLIKKIN